MTAFGSWGYGPVETGHAMCLAPCISCGRTFGFDPETVPSSRVHPATRCTIRPDGTSIEPGDADGVLEPLCPGCAARFAAHGGQLAPVMLLFPYARFDLIDVARARELQRGAA